jgi:hypothetical protein
MDRQRRATEPIGFKKELSNRDQRETEMGSTTTDVSTDKVAGVDKDMCGKYDVHRWGPGGLPSHCMETDDRILIEYKKNR